MTKITTRRLPLALIVCLLLAACSGQAPDSTPLATAPVATQPPAAASEAPTVTQAPPQDQRPETQTPGPTTAPTTPPSAQDQTSLQQLQAAQWVLHRYRDAAGTMQDVPLSERGTAIFGPDRVNGSAFCNSYFASYQVENDTLSITQPGATLMACQPPKSDLEQIFLERLVQAATFTVTDQQLILRNQAGEEILIFGAEAVPGAPAAGTPASGTPGAGASAGIVTSDIPAGLQPDSLANARYQTGFTNNGSAQLKDGAYEEPGPPGSNSTNTVRMAEGGVAFGSLPDGKPAAAVVTGSKTGGSGTFYELHLVGLLDNGQPVDLAYAFLGDRVQINALKFVDGQIVVDLITQGPNDPMCCPTMAQVLNFQYTNGSLVARAPSDTVSITPGVGAAPGATAAPGDVQPALGGVIWRWTEFQDAANQRLLVNQPERYLVEFLPDNSLRVQADCNSGSGGYDLDGSQLKIEGIGLTKMLCPPASLSDAFVQNLLAVVSYAIRGNTLFLSLKDNAGTMQLTPAP